MRRMDVGGLIAVIGFAGLAVEFHLWLINLGFVVTGLYWVFKKN